ncbi:hypothetical protein J2W40_002196 [Sphingobium xenophagum]|uniref:Uncharacterized protein n=1 Tax=Sphingobium xenophagum TaxID=121428 RepID=A0ABU1X1P6_SPHXE|nr:hypothetical protein [Sphingobium xenophagum]MDR7155369.1 hypothetical protein [Sphingobium xenophagum]
MGRWLDLAKEIDGRATAGQDGAIVPNVPIVLTPSPRDLFRSWDKSVASLDPDKPLGGYAPDRWQRIVRDCDRLIADFGKGAASLGWSTLDLFGFPAGDCDTTGGLAWRLDGGRIIAMDGHVATYRWPFSDRTSRYAKSYLAELASPFVPVWELSE